MNNIGKQSLQEEISERLSDEWAGKYRVNMDEPLLQLAKRCH